MYILNPSEMQLKSESFQTIMNMNNVGWKGGGG